MLYKKHCYRNGCRTLAHMTCGETVSSRSLGKGILTLPVWIFKTLWILKYHGSNNIIACGSFVEAHFIKTALVVFDVVVISMCSLSLVLCGRSIYRSLKLAKVSW